uniref:ApaG domain-containing protein n=1 Tax=Panagrolaimus superbus TaxID=310955 RepID=A0A914YA61_9BILA
MICMGRISILHIARRTFATSNVNFVRFRGSSTNPPLELVKVGKLCGSKKEGLFEPGQLFLHRVFAYRGVIVCSFNVKVKEIVKPNEAIDRTEIIPYYQVLIDRKDWDYMNFHPEMTSYFTESAVGREKLLTVINGMDCVPHHEIIPYSTTEKDAIKHDLFARIFEPNEESNDGPNFNIKKNLFPNFAVSNKKSWLTPQSVHVATNENVQLSVIPYYLGQSFTAGQQKYFWRYTVRLQSLDKKPAVLRDRILKVFSLNNLQQVNGPGVNGENPRLTAENSVYQFSSIVELSQPKGGHMWGRFTMERDDGSTFEILMPTIPLECHPESTSEQNEFENNHN